MKKASGTLWHQDSARLFDASKVPDTFFNSICNKHTSIRGVLAIHITHFSPSGHTCPTGGVCFGLPGCRQTLIARHSTGTGVRRFPMIDFPRPRTTGFRNSRAVHKWLRLTRIIHVGCLKSALFKWCVAQVVWLAAQSVLCEPVGLPTKRTSGYRLASHTLHWS